MAHTIPVDAAGFPVFVKVDTPDSLDYAINLTAWLAGDMLTSHTMAVESGMTVDSSIIAGDDIRAFVSGGTAGSSYLLDFQFTTAGGVGDARSIRINVVQRRGV